MLPDYIERARGILYDAIAEYRPAAVFAGFSGGHDSLVSTHFTMGEVPGATALHINTGIGIEATRRFVRETCTSRSWPLGERTAEAKYEDLVLGRITSYPGGFPGAPMHPGMYRRLKERPLHQAASLARSIAPRLRRGRRWVFVVTGIRGDESVIRTGYKQAVRADSEHSIVWLSPFYWATYDHFRDYRRRYDLPANPVCLTLGFSGECLCGAHADKGELLRVRLVEPATADYLEDLQRRVADAGFPWGYEDNGPPRWFQQGKRGQAFFGFHEGSKADYRPMCHNCDKVKEVPCNMATEGAA